MQIVIDIPENIYEYYKNKYHKNCVELTFVENALLEGTLLPKGHGRLIDADSLILLLGKNHEIVKIIKEEPTIIQGEK